jgi:choline dehydrogenase-like flavoprotein
LATFGKTLIAMLIDLHQLSSDTSPQADICIIGGGIAGLVLADSLRGSGLQVSLLEAGGLSLESRSQDLYAADIIGQPHSGTTDGRFRVLGGSSTRWGGQILPLADQDFSRRSHVPYSGWPIASKDLEPYYAKVEEILGVNHLPFTSDLLMHLPLSHPKKLQNGLQMRFSKWAPFNRRNFAKTLGRRVQCDPDTKIFYHANVTLIQLHPEGYRVDWVEAKTYEGQTVRFFANQFIICAGTIETCRILLVSNNIQSRGIGNHYDLVGRYFHDHLSMSAARILPQSRQAFLEQFAPWFLGQTRHTLKLESTEEFQSQNNSLNSMGHFVFEAPKDTAFSLIKQFMQQNQGNIRSPALVPNIDLLPKELLDLIYLTWQAKLKKRRWSPSRAELLLYIDCEQQPNPNSRISISCDRDVLGLPKTVVDWRWGEPERHTMQAYKQIFTEKWEGWGLGKLKWLCNFEEDSDWKERISDIYHPMGGTRMSFDYKHGVVNSDLRLHSVANLYVASCSIFPTGGSSNPTMTMMAATLRLAAHLKTSLLKT